MTAKYLTIRSTSLCAFLRYNQYLEVRVTSAVVIPRARIPWVTNAKPMGVVLNFRSYVVHGIDSRKSWIDYGFL